MLISKDRNIILFNFIRHKHNSNTRRKLQTPKDEKIQNEFISAMNSNKLDEYFKSKSHYKVN